MKKFLTVLVAILVLVVLIGLLLPAKVKVERREQDVAEDKLNIKNDI